MTSVTGLALLRKRLGYTLEEIAAKMPVSAGTISRIENGETSYYRNRYERLLAELRLERLREEVRAFPADTWKFIGEIFSERVNDGHNDQEGPPAQLAAV
jgi:transcriptional regulator with XRE-family HTH domain